jgi:hypothetical protein
MAKWQRNIINQSGLASANEIMKAGVSASINNQRRRNGVAYYINEISAYQYENNGIEIMW